VVQKLLDAVLAGTPVNFGCKHCFMVS